MPQKNHSRSHMKAEFRRRRTRQKWIRNIAVGLFILVLIGLIWVAFFSQKSSPAAGSTTATTVPGPTVHEMQFDALPAMQIDVKKQYFATVTLAKGGQFVIQLFPDKAPQTVNSFIFLSQQGYFNGVTFHRVLQDFMAQAGDPTGTGHGGPGYSLPDEITDLTFDKAGVLAMANTGAPNSGGSQFFITFGPVERLNGGYTIFGQVVEGMDVVNNITLRDPDKNPQYQGDAIESITISVK
jgi:peptidylprolyl isomerase